MSNFYLDTLPLHPQPERLESLSSYVMRIAEMNGINQIRTLYKLLCIYISRAAAFSDYLPHFLAELALRTACPESRLLATTFFYAGEKFGRSPRANGLSRFFQGSLGEYLRYCPLCLSETEYYPLTWRFLSLVGCSTHRCQILDRCGHCNNHIPLFSIPAKVGVCATCDKSLRLCSAETLAEQELQGVYRRTSDLEYLLSPLADETLATDDEKKISKTRAIGGRLRELRQERQYSIEQVARDLAETASSIKAHELGTQRRWISFQTYLKYADYLGITLMSIVALPLTLFSPHQEGLQTRSQQERFGVSTARQLRREKREHELFEEVQEAVQTIKAWGDRVTFTAISKYVHVNPTNLRRYASIRSFWEQVSRDQQDEKERVEDDLVKHIEQAVVFLKKCEKTVSEKAISEIVQIPIVKLRHHPRVNSLLKRILHEGRPMQEQSKQLSECHIVEQMLAVIGALKASGEPVTQERISNGVGLSLHRLQQVPQADRILKQAIVEEHVQRKQQSHRHGQELNERVQQAIEQLRLSGREVLRKAVAECVGVSVTTLSRCEEVQPILARVIEEYRQSAHLQAQQRERQLIELVRQAIEQLRGRGKRVTQRAVGEIVGLSDAGLQYYSGFRKLYARLQEENQYTYQQQAQQREEKLIQRIKDAMLQLSGEEKPLTLQNIANIIGMSIAGLRKYPRINEMFNDLIQKRKKHRSDANRSISGHL